MVTINVYTLDEEVPVFGFIRSTDEQQYLSVSLSKLLAFSLLLVLASGNADED
jgi:hypothetical protein